MRLKKIIMGSFFVLLIIFILPLIGKGNLNILYMVRLKRVLMAFFTGAGLCLATYVLQNITRNALTSEYTLGISASAVFFAALGTIVGVSTYFFSMIGGLGVTFFIFLLLKRNLNSQSLILLGIILNIFFASGIVLLNYITAFKSSLSLAHMIFGQFMIYDWSKIIIMLLVVVIMLVLVLLKYPQLTLISISGVYEDILGKSFKKYYMIILIIIGVFISLSITYSGPIPFYALLLANMVRFKTGGNPLNSIFLVFLLGGILLAAMDTIAKVITSFEEFPLGVITGIIGLPFIGVMLYKKRF